MFLATVSTTRTTFQRLPKSRLCRYESLKSLQMSSSLLISYRLNGMSMNFIATVTLCQSKRNHLRQSGYQKMMICRLHVLQSPWLPPTCRAIPALTGMVNLAVSVYKDWRFFPRLT